MDTVTHIILLTVSQLCQLLGCIFFFGFVLKWVGENTLKKFAHDHFLFHFMSIIGTPIHEFGHFIMCKLFGYRINKVVWVQKPQADGTLGYVNFSYNPKNFYQLVGKFFVGIGPLFSGPLCILLLLYFLLPTSFQVVETKIGHIPAVWQLSTFYDLFKLSGQFLVSLFTLEHVLSWQLYVFLIVASAIAVHIRLSMSDLESATSGIFSLSMALLIINVFSTFLGLTLSDHLSHYISTFTAYYIATMVIILVISLLLWLLSIIWHTMLHRNAR